MVKDPWRNWRPWGDKATKAPSPEPQPVVEVLPIEKPRPDHNQFSSRPDWFKVKSEIEKQLDMHRLHLETPGMQHSETEGHRYAILELKGLLNLAKPSKMQATGSEN